MRLNLDLLAEDFQEPETPRDRRVLQKIERLRRESSGSRTSSKNFLRFARVQDLRLEPADLNASSRSCATSASRRRRRRAS